MLNPRQQKVVQQISDFIRNPSGETINYGSILRQAGYSESTSKKPNLVLKSKEIQTALQEELNNESMDIQVKLQHAFLINQFGNLSVKAKAIDMYYKLTGKYQAEKIDVAQDREISEALEKIGKLLP
jgi:hypothetical protein